jgi:pSer/pThr/pTyr-binding forkhead associated (FHA) protein
MSWPSFTVTTPRATERVSFEAESGRVGRSQESTVIIRADLTVSNHHLDILRQEGQWFMISRVPFGRTRLNERPIPQDQPTLLSDGDVIEIGATQMVYHAPVRRSVRSHSLVDTPTTTLPPTPSSSDEGVLGIARGESANPRDDGDTPRRIRLPTPEPKEPDGLEEPEPRLGELEPDEGLNTESQRNAPPVHGPAPTPGPRPPGPDRGTPQSDVVEVGFTPIDYGSISPPPAPAPPPPPPPPASNVPEDAMEPSGRLIELLPPPLQDDDFLRRFLLIFEGVWDSIERRQEHIELMFDAESAPPEFCRWMDSWLTKRRGDGHELRAFGTDGGGGNRES